MSRKTIHHSSSLFMLLISLTLVFSCSQDKTNRKSPPAEVSGTIGEAKLSLVYSQPAVKGRSIWGDLVPYDRVWRTGANEATVFTVDQDIKVMGQDLAKGSYALFTIPAQEEWTIIFNTKADQWGAFKYKQEEDMLRVKVKPLAVDELQERMTFSLDEEKAVLTLAWEKIQVPIELK